MSRTHSEIQHEQFKAVNPFPPGVETVRRDSEIEQQVLRSFTLALGMTSSEICVESNEGVVTLNGTAQNRRHRSVIYSAACLASGVCRVVNNIGIKKRIDSIPKRSRNGLPITINRVMAAPRE